MVCISTSSSSSSSSILLLNPFYYVTSCHCRPVDRPRLPPPTADPACALPVSYLLLSVNKRHTNYLPAYVCCIWVLSRSITITLGINVTPPSICFINLLSSSLVVVSNYYPRMDNGNMPYRPQKYGLC